MHINLAVLITTVDKIVEILSQLTIRIRTTVQYMGLFQNSCLTHFFLFLSDGESERENQEKFHADKYWEHLGT